MFSPIIIWLIAVIMASPVRMLAIAVILNACGQISGSRRRDKEIAVLEKRITSLERTLKSGNKN